MKAWTITLPDDPELRAIFGDTLILDNLGYAQFIKAPGRVAQVDVIDASTKDWRSLFNIGVAMKPAGVRFGLRPIK